MQMQSYLKAFNLWEVVETGIEPIQRHANLTLAQIRQFEEDKAKRYKALSCVQSVIFYEIFARIMHLDNPKEVWDHSKEEFHGSDKTRKIQALNLFRQFEMLTMDDNETIKEFFGKMMGMVNQLRGFRAEQRRAFRQKRLTENALVVKTKNKKLGSSIFKRNEANRKDKGKKVDEKRHGDHKKTFPPYSHGKKTNHIEKFCWFKPNVECKKCHQQGHVEKVCKNKVKNVMRKLLWLKSLKLKMRFFFMAKNVDSEEEKNTWLLDSGCSNHLTGCKDNFINLDSSFRTKIEVGNGDFLLILGIGTVGVHTPASRRLIYHVYFAFDVSQNLLIIGQLIDDNYMLVFKDRACTVSDPTGIELFTIGGKVISTILT
ncbi:Gag-pol polyprotein-like protein [Theobroma cacao]|uniref:Gag-pol polyprotein-like protein n=1 Tax=Theobroma cacao TaxID=3641 RepID=A0A061FFT2_THECC|nr:Gag-pol polyprotein-like protein [Theobroma cacao]